MSDAQSQTNAGDDGKDRQRPTGERLTDASEFVARHLGRSDQPADTEAEQAAAGEANGSDGVNGANADAAGSPAPEAEEAEAPISGADMPPPIMPYMLPPLQDGADTELPPMFGDYGPTDGDPSPLRFLREPVQYVGNEGKPGNGDAQPAADGPEADVPEVFAAEQEARAPDADAALDTPDIDAAPTAAWNAADVAAAEQLAAEPSGGNASSILSAIDAAERNIAAPEGLNLRLSIRVPRMLPDEPVAALPNGLAMEAEAVEPVAYTAEPQAFSEAPRFDEASVPDLDALPVEDVQATEQAWPPPLAAMPPPLPELPPDDTHEAVDTVAEADAVAGSLEDVAYEDIPPPPLAASIIAASSPPALELLPETQVSQGYDVPHQAAAEQEAEPPDALRAAAARIAAEATATAQALESLKRLLESNRLPDTQVVAPPLQMQRPPLIQRERARERAPSPPPSAVGQPARATAGLPPYRATPPLPVPIFEPQFSGGGRIYLLGFLAGFGLALAAGAMLYLFISIG